MQEGGTWNHYFAMMGTLPGCHRLNVLINCVITKVAGPPDVMLCGQYTLSNILTTQTKIEAGFKQRFKYKFQRTGIRE